MVIIFLRYDLKFLMVEIKEVFNYFWKVGTRTNLRLTLVPSVSKIIEKQCYYILNLVSQLRDMISSVENIQLHSWIQWSTSQTRWKHCHQISSKHSTFSTTVVFCRRSSSQGSELYIPLKWFGNFLPGRRHIIKIQQALQCLFETAIYAHLSIRRV